MKNSVRALAWLCASLAMAGVAACGGEDEKPKPEDNGNPGGDAGTDGDAAADGGAEDAGETPAASQSWTFFVYGHGDHNLSHALVRDIAEMASANIGANVNVVVLADYDSSQVAGQNPDGSDLFFPEGSEWYHVLGGGEEPELVGTEPEQNLDDPEVLSAAIAKAFTTYKADRHALILWDHGGSWKQGYGSDSQNGTADEPKPMLPATVASAVRAGLAEAGITKPLDIFSFDACLMAGAEVAWEFLQVADVYIGNAEIDYGDGWDFEGFLNHLSTHSADTSRALGEAEAKLWDAHHRSATANDTILRSHVALDTQKLSDFGDDFAAFAEAFRSSSSIAGGAAARAAYFTLPPYLNELSGPTSAPELRDIGQFLHLVSAAEGSDVQASATTALASLEAAILGRSQGVLRDMAGQYGVHFELPLASQFSVATYNEYVTGAAEWNGQSGWDDALKAYAESDDGQAPSVNGVLEAGELEGTPVYFVNFTTTDADVAEAAAYLAGVEPSDPNTLTVLGLIAKGAVLPSAADDPYSIVWDGTLLTVVDSQGNASLAAASVWEDLGSSIDGEVNVAPLLAITGVFSPGPGEQYVAVLLYQDGEEHIETLSLLDPPITFSLAEIASDYPGSTFSPLFEQVSLQQGTSDTVLGGDVIPLDAPSLSVAWVPANDGTYAIRTEVTDVFGNAGADVTYMSLPIPQ